MGQNETAITFEAIDSLMFRDGKPFNQGDAGASSAASVFPPFPPTLVGAVRAALWRQLGEWVPEKLGNGTNWQADGTLGLLHFGPPLVVRDHEPVFPVPLHIVEGKSKDGTKHLSRLAPGDALTCDLEQPVKFPAAIKQLEGIKQIADRWVSAKGMRAILDGGLPQADALIKIGKLWKTEPRVGIGINPDTRATGDGRLYMASHVRLCDTVKLSVSLSGWEGSLDALPLQPLAGEHRMAQLDVAGKRVSLPFTKLASARRYCIILVSPMVPDILPGPSGKFPAMPGRLVSACLGKAISIGGWDSGNKQPVPLRQAIPAGSVWFMELDTDETPDWDALPDGLGMGAAWGFGHYILGKW